jgi:hypothetical protein
VVVVVVAANIMEKFTLGNRGTDPLIRTDNDANVARFAHINRMVEDYQTFTTVITAEQAATLASAPVELNVPEGMYALAGGYVYYSSTATVPLEVGSEQLVCSFNANFIISKNASGNINVGEILFLAPLFNLSVRLVNNINYKYYFTTDADAETPPDGPVEVTLYLTKINLSII